MTHGVMGVVCCPMVDDNLVYSITNDRDEKSITIVRNGNEGSITRKLDKAGVTYDTIFWQDVVKRTYVPKDGFNILIVMISLGLHARPDVLKSTVEDLTKTMQGVSDTIGFYLGTCGNYGWNIPKWCASNGYKPAFTFCDCNGNVCDDCVGINVAGGPRYMEMEKKYTGYLYVFPAMASNYDDFMNADKSESLKIENSITDEMREELGIEHGPDGYMRWLLRLGNYEHILKIDTGIGDRENFDKNVSVVAKRTALSVKVAEDGWASLQPTDDLYKNCKSKLPQ